MRSRINPTLQTIREWAKSLKVNIQALWLATGDPRISVVPRLLIFLVVAYALSPLDLIPDFIPILGYIDDLILLPLGIWLVIRLIPPEILEEYRKKAASQSLALPKSYGMAAFIATLWAFSIILTSYLAWCCLTVCP